MKVLDWTARRSGATITVTGRDSAGNQTRITDVSAIWPRGSKLFARAGTGTLHELVIS